jgi:peptidyl-prolyl cis-trans isomerase C
MKELIMTVKPARLLVILVALIIAVALPAFAQNIAIVNGKAIPASAVDALVKQAVAQGQADTPELRKAAKEQLIDQAIFFQEANKQGYGKHPDVKQQLEQDRQMIMIRAMLTDYFKKNPIKDADIQSDYEKFKAQTANTKEYHASHILVENEDEAKAIIAKLKAGSKFEELAKESKDQASAARGGNLDWAPATNYVKPFGDALAALGKGELTDTPVKTEFGYHVIKLEDVRTPEVPTLEELKSGIVQSLQEKQFIAFQDKLRKKAKIK